MPVIVFEGGKMDASKKKELISRFTRSAAEITGIDPQSFVVYIKENELDNVGVGGRVLSEVLAERN
jgi:4-oxalocrotonate tautomerase